MIHLNDSSPFDSDSVIWNHVWSADKKHRMMGGGRTSLDINVNGSAVCSEKSRGGTRCDLQHQVNVMNATTFVSFYFIYAWQWGAATPRFTKNPCCHVLKDRRGGGAKSCTFSQFSVCTKKKPSFLKRWFRVLSFLQLFLSFLHFFDLPFLLKIHPLKCFWLSLRRNPFTNLSTTCFTTRLDSK